MLPSIDEIIKFMKLCKSLGALSIQPCCHEERFKKSFIPTSVRLYNNNNYIYKNNFMLMVYPAKGGVQLEKVLITICRHVLNS